jgi:hypothetical protein
MVGFIKELVDELGIDMITNPSRGSKEPQRYPRFQRMEIYPGQVFVFKVTKAVTNLMSSQVNKDPHKRNSD